jgi:hypothetical protein
MNEGAPRDNTGRRRCAENGRGAAKNCDWRVCWHMRLKPLDAARQLTVAQRRGIIGEGDLIPMIEQGTRDLLWNI